MANKSSVYPWVHCLRCNGTITQGPNKGKVLVDHIQEVMAKNPPFIHGTLELAREYASKYRALEPAVKIEIMRKQFRDDGTRGYFHYEFVELA